MKNEQHEFKPDATFAFIQGQLQRMKVGALNDVECSLRESGRHVETIGVDTFLPTGDLHRVLELPFSGHQLSVTVGNNHAFMVIRTHSAGGASVLNLCDPHWLAILSERLSQGSEAQVVA